MQLLIQIAQIVFLVIKIVLFYSFRIEDFVNYKSKLPEKLKKPFCSSSFEFSMFSYDHLKGVANRKHLINSSEAGLINPVPQAKNIGEFGHRIYEALAKVWANE